MNPTEHQEQVALCRWLDLHGIPYLAIPNGGRRDLVEAARLKAEGVKRGAPDLLVFFANGQNVALEMKARSGGRISPEQKEWQGFFAGRIFWTAMITYGCQDAIGKLEAML
jgi:hypothetical protein